MLYTVQIRRDSEAFWDEIYVRASNREEQVIWYARKVYVGQSRALALSKAWIELESMLVHDGWLEPGELSPIGPVDVAGSSRATPESSSSLRRDRRPK